MTLSSYLVHFDFFGFGGVVEADFGVAVGSVDPALGDLVAQFDIGGAVSQDIAQVGALGGKETGVEFAVGGEASAGAVTTKGLGDRGNHADFAATIGVAISFCNFACVVGVEGFKR